MTGVSQNDTAEALELVEASTTSANGKYTRPSPTKLCYMFAALCEIPQSLCEGWLYRDIYPTWLEHETAWIKAEVWAAPSRGGTEVRAESVNPGGSDQAPGPDGPTVTSTDIGLPPRYADFLRDVTFGQPVEELELQPGRGAGKAWTAAEFYNAGQKVTTFYGWPWYKQAWRWLRDGGKWQFGEDISYVESYGITLPPGAELIPPGGDSMATAEKRPTNTDWGWLVTHQTGATEAICDNDARLRSGWFTDYQKWAKDTGNATLTRLKRGDGDVPCLFCGKSAAT